MGHKFFPKKKKKIEQPLCKSFFIHNWLISDIITNYGKERNYRREQLIFKKGNRFQTT